MSKLDFLKRDSQVPNSAKKARKQSKVPGVLYGRAMKNVMFEVGEMELCSEIAVNGEHGVIEFELEGEEHKALLKEVQRDPLTNKIIHIDLEELKGKDRIITNVPIHFIGEENISKRGSVLQKEKDTVKIQCSITSIPKSVNINVAKGDIGAVYKFGDLEIASEISVLDDLNSVIASISYERKTVSDDMELAANSNEKGK